MVSSIFYLILLSAFPITFPTPPSSSPDLFPDTLLYFLHFLLPRLTPIYFLILISPFSTPSSVSTTHTRPSGAKICVKSHWFGSQTHAWVNVANQQRRVKHQAVNINRWALHMAALSSALSLFGGHHHSKIADNVTEAETGEASRNSRYRCCYFKGSYPSRKKGVQFIVGDTFHLWFAIGETCWISML